MSLPACMGGWCLERNRCAQYLTAPRGTEPEHVSERLCLPGQESPRPMFMVERAAAALEAA